MKLAKAPRVAREPQVSHLSAIVFSRHKMKMNLYLTAY